MIFGDLGVKYAREKEEEEKRFSEMLGNYTREKEDEDDDWIKYFDHPHHWLSLGETDNSEIDCPVCRKKLG